jgi:hypothetical protein
MAGYRNEPVVFLPGFPRILLARFDDAYARQRRSVTYTTPALLVARAAEH